MDLSFRAGPLVNCLAATAAMAVACAGISGCAWLESKAERKAVAAQQWVDQARTAENRLDLCEATECLGRAVDINPTDIEAHRQLGEVLSKQGRYQEALRHLEYAAGRDPHDVLVWIALTRARIEEGEPLKAMDAIDQALTVEPSNTEALLLQAQLFGMRGENHQAQVVYNRILMFEPRHIQASLQLAKLQMQFGHPDRAAPLFRALAHRSDVTPQQRVNAEWELGIAYGTMARWQDASRTLQRAIVQREASADDWYRLAYAHYQQGAHAEAQQALAAALERNPTHAAASAMAATLRTVPRTATTANLQIRQTKYSNRHAVPAPPGW